MAFACLRFCFFRSADPAHHITSHQTSRNLTLSCIHFSCGYPPSILSTRQFSYRDRTTPPQYADNHSPSDERPDRLSLTTQTRPLIFPSHSFFRRRATVKQPNSTFETPGRHGTLLQVATAPTLSSQPTATNLTLHLTSDGSMSFQTPTSTCPTRPLPTMEAFPIVVRPSLRSRRPLLSSLPSLSPHE